MGVSNGDATVLEARGNRCKLLWRLAGFLKPSRNFNILGPKKWRVEFSRIDVGTPSVCELGLHAAVVQQPARPLMRANFSTSASESPRSPKMGRISRF